MSTYSYSADMCASDGLALPYFTGCTSNCSVPSAPAEASCCAWTMLGNEAVAAACGADWVCPCAAPRTMYCAYGVAV